MTPEELYPTAKTGPQHFREAERLIGFSWENRTHKNVMHLLARAQVHATLALAAATVLGTVVDPAADHEAEAWMNTISVEPVFAAEQQPARDPEPADEQPRDIFGRCAVHLLPLNENGVCQFNEDDQHPEKDDAEEFEREGDVIDAADRAQHPERFGWAAPVGTTEADR